MIYVFLSIALLFALGAPAWSEELPAPVAAMIPLTEGIVYRIAQLNDRQLAKEAAPTLTLDKESGRLTGFSGVNRLWRRIYPHGGSVDVWTDAVNEHGR